MPTPQRQVRRLRLGAPSAHAARALLPRLEDALRCASLPDTGAQWLLVRRLALGPVAAGASPQVIALRIEQQLQAAGVHWVDGAAGDAVAAAHVRFASALQAHETLAWRVLRGQPCRAWYWARVAPGFSADAPPSRNLAAIECAVAAGPQGALALAAWRDALRTQAAPSPAAGALRPPRGGAPHDPSRPATAVAPGRDTAVAEHALEAGAVLPAPPQTAPTGAAPPMALLRGQDKVPTPDQPPARPPADTMPIGGPGARDGDASADGAPAGGGRNLSSAAATGPADARSADKGQPSRTHVARRPAAQAARAPTAGDAARPARPATAGPAAARDAGARRPTLPTAPPDAAALGAGPGAGHPALDEPQQTPSGRGPRPAATQALARQTGAAPPDNTPVDAHAHAAGLQTTHAGLLFLLPVLARLGLPDWAQSQGGDARTWAGAVLQAALQRLQAEPAEPLFQLVPGPAPAPAGAAPLLWAASALAPPRGRPQPTLADAWSEATTAQAQAALWLQACRRWLRRGPRIGLASLVCRPGRVGWSPTHADVCFDLATADLRVRRHGLDIDPGWLPWFGRVVAFHYERPR